MKTKEEIMIKHCSDNKLLNMNLGKSILAAMEEYAQQQCNICLSKNIILQESQVCSCAKNDCIYTIDGKVHCSNCGGIINFNTST